MEIPAGFKKVEDCDVFMIWIPQCECDDCEPVELTPDFYQHNGTPICMCGEDMEYEYTIVRE